MAIYKTLNAENNQLDKLAADAEKETKPAK